MFEQLSGAQERYQAINDRLMDPNVVSDPKQYAELMKELGLTMNTSALGVTEDMLEGLADVTIHLTGGYKDLDREEILQIFRESLG